jgi:hypothetical protein
MRSSFDFAAAHADFESNALFTIRMTLIMLAKTIATFLFNSFISHFHTNGLQMYLGTFLCMNILLGWNLLKGGASFMQKLSCSKFYFKQCHLSQEIICFCRNISL